MDVTSYEDFWFANLFHDCKATMEEREEISAPLFQIRDAWA
jgi:hypothetical protein